jgi:alanyl-tRNA synthetase
LNVSIGDVTDRIDALLADRKRLITELKTVTDGGQLSADELIAGGQTVAGTLVVVAETPGANPNVMRGWIDQIRKKTDGESAVLLASVAGEKVLLVGGLSRGLVEKGLKAGQWVGDAAKVVGGGGGGRPDMAQAGGKDPSKLPQALEEATAAMVKNLS